MTHPKAITLTKALGKEELKEQCLDLVWGLGLENLPALQTTTVPKETSTENFGGREQTGGDVSELSFGPVCWISMAWKGQNCSWFSVPWHGRVRMENGKQAQTNTSHLSSWVWEQSPPCHPHASWVPAPARDAQSRDRAFAEAGGRAGHTALATLVPQLHQNVHSDAYSDGNRQDSQEPFLACLNPSGCRSGAAQMKRNLWSGLFPKRLQKGFLLYSSS